MALKLYRPITPGSRFASGLTKSHLSSVRPHKRLVSILAKRSGRNATGRITTRHQGRRQKRYLREIDTKRNKRDLPGQVVSVEYDPNRSADIALVKYPDGDKRYIVAPEGLVVGQTIVSGESAPLTVGNALPLRSIPVGTLVHNLEIVPGKGGQLARGAGSAAAVAGFETDWALVKLPSGEIRRFPQASYATIGQVGNVEWKNVHLGRAGRSRLMGRRPTVRGTAQNPRSHPHGGGEGRSGEGMHPKTPWGKPARGKHTRSRKRYSQKLIVSRRK